MKNIKKFTEILNEEKEQKAVLYKTVIEVEILSEEVVPDNISLCDIEHEIDEGAWSGVVRTAVSSKKLEGKEAVDAVRGQGTDLDFFRMDDNGNVTE